MSDYQKGTIKLKIEILYELCGEMTYSSTVQISRVKAVIWVESTTHGQTDTWSGQIAT